MLHLVLHELLHLIELARNYLEDQLIMDLKQHFALQMPGLQRIIDPDHRDLDQIGSGSLNRRIGSNSFTKCTNVEIPFAQLRDISPPPEYRLHISVLASECHP